uniref:Uncharacterized protein n=1 Tax=Anguilla anguilla TaxID=7936 RepID=A0A0E9SD00_ANGAN
MFQRLGGSCLCLGMVRTGFQQKQKKTA